MSANNPQRLIQALALLNDYIASDETDELFFQNRFVRWQQASLTAHDVRLAASILERHVRPEPTPKATAVTAAA